MTPPKSKAGCGAACANRSESVDPQLSTFNPQPPGGWWANVADGRICGRNRGRSGSTCGNPGAEAPAPEPAPAAPQRLPRFLWQPAASQHLWLIPPTLGRRLAMLGRATGWPQAEKIFERALYSRMGREYNRPDERKWF